MQPTEHSGSNIISNIIRNLNQCKNNNNFFHYLTTMQFIAVIMKKKRKFKFHIEIGG